MTFGSFYGVLLVSLLLAACAGSQASEYRALQQRYEEFAPPPRAPDQDVELGAPLERDALIAAVLARNPNLEAARLAWKAALEEYPQSSTLPDPSLSYSLAPLTIASQDASFGQSIQVTQRFPAPGTLGARGRAAVAEAEAAMHDWRAARRELALTASLLYDDYFVVDRALAINQDFIALMEQIRESALARYSVGQAAQKDPIEAELELAHLRRQRVQLETRRAKLVASLNRLLHRPAAAELPAPPDSLELPQPDETTAQVLEQLALEQRDELAASAARIQAAEARSELARRMYRPSFGVMANYSSMWQMLEHQFMVGFMVDLPIWRAGRAAAVDEAQSSLERLSRLREAVVDDVRAEVEMARLEYQEAVHVVSLYRDRILPTAEQLVETAQAGYETGANDFADVLQAERALQRARLEYQTAVASAYQALARLKRSVGKLPTDAVDTEPK